MTWPGRRCRRRPARGIRPSGQHVPPWTRPVLRCPARCRRCRRAPVRARSASRARTRGRSTPSAHPVGSASAGRCSRPTGPASVPSVRWRDRSGGSNALRMLIPRGEQTVWIGLESELGMQTVLELGLDGSADTALDTGVPDASTAVRAALTGGSHGRVVADTGDPATSSVVTAASGSPWSTEAGALRCRVEVAAGERTTIRLDVAVGTASTSDAVPADWDALRERQAQTHGRLVGVSTLDLGADRSTETTEQLWEAARQGEPGARRRVVEVAYLSGRANVVASTGELPPTLQGVWQGTWRPAWSADYTMNGNVQNGGIAGLIPTGTPELARSLLA